MGYAIIRTLSPMSGDILVSQAALTIPSRPPAKQIERMAWAIVWFSFVLFCAVCIAITTGVYAFLFYSVVPLNVEAQVGKGTVVISSADAGERGQRVRENLPMRPAQMSTDALSQATLVFNIPEDTHTQFVAAVTLKSNSSITLRRANRPRFDSSSGRYEIELSDLKGDIEVVIGNTDTRQVWIQITTLRDETVTLTQPGRYVISASDLRVQVANRRGEAILSSADGSYNLLLPAGQDGLLVAGRTPVTSPPRTNLIDHGLFIFDALNTTNESTVEDKIQLPIHWGCANAQKEAPRGAYNVAQSEGRTALELARGNNATTNGETRCKQTYAPPGLDVTGYSFLELETTFLIQYQSISECGVEGSECPLMMHLLYTDVHGVQREWYQGFYSLLDPLYDFYKSRCASCTQDHEQINEKVWYTYESGNLLNIFPSDALPATINMIELYASGHQYDVYIGEISLFAGIVEAVPPDGTAPLGTKP